MERWKDIPGFEGLYQASDQGNIRTCAGKTTSNALYPCRVWKQRVLKQKFQYRNKGTKQDARVCLWKDNKGYTFLVSRLVAMTWCPGYADGATVNHIDGNPLNNCVENLEWVSLAENIRKGFEAGFFKNSQIAVELHDEKGNRLPFSSLAEASRYLGRNHGYVSNMLHRGKTHLGGYEVVLP